MKYRVNKTIQYTARICGLFVTLILAGVLVAHGQQPNDKPSAKKPDLAARNIEVTIRLVAYSRKTFTDVPVDHFKVGDPINIEVVFTNRMENTTDVDISSGNYVFQWRPRLLKDGKLLHYPEGLSKRLEKVDNNEPFYGSRVFHRLEPGKPELIGSLGLNEWYDALAPGHYELTMWHRFWGKEKPAKSNTVTFEIVP